MTSIVTDFKSIARKLNRMEQKADFEAKNPVIDPMEVGWPFGVMTSGAVPLAGVATGGTSASGAVGSAALPPYTPATQSVNPNALADLYRAAMKYAQSKI